MANKASSIPLNPLRTFAVASRHASFSAAARELGVTQVAVSRQIAVVEDYFDTLLFERSGSENKLTDAGRALSRQIAPLFDELDTATSEFLEQERKQAVNLRCYPTFAYGWLMPRLPEFSALHPGFDMRFDTTVEPLDFRGTYLDVAVQLGRGDWTGVKARELFPEEIDAVCSPAYAERIEASVAKCNLEDAVLLHSRYRRKEWQDWSRTVGIDVAGLPSYEFQSSLLTYRAAKEGLGVAMAQLDLIEDELKAGTLVRPFEQTVQTGSSFWVVWPTTLSVNMTTKKFIDWLLVRAGQQPQFFDGAAAQVRKS